MPENSREPYLSNTLQPNASSIALRDPSGSVCADEMIPFGRIFISPCSCRYLREEVERLGVAVEQHRLELLDRRDELAQRLVGHLVRRDELAPRQQRVGELAHHLRLRHAERLVPQPQLPVAEAPAGPLHRAQRRRPAELELRAIDEADERLARRARGRDLQDLGLVVVVAHDVEVEVLAHVVLRQERQLLQIVERADVVGHDAQLAHAVAVERHVR